jgi:hypothetical protein
VDLRIRGNSGRYLSPVVRFVFISGCLVVLAAIVFWNAARWLVVDAAARSDVILILDGSIDGHFARGLGLFQEGYGKQIVVTEDVDQLVFGRTRADLANQFIRDRVASLANRIDVCPTRGDLRESVVQVIRCIPNVGVQRILLVTSDYETRRTLSIFNRLVPRYHWSVSAAEDPSQFGYKWWRHRQWAKRMVVGWNDLLWWNCVERWQRP